MFTNFTKAQRAEHYPADRRRFIGVKPYVLVAFAFFAHWMSWQRPRWLQNTEKIINGTLWRSSINIFKPNTFFEKKDISHYFWRTEECQILNYGEIWQKMILKITN